MLFAVGVTHPQYYMDGTEDSLLSPWLWPNRIIPPFVPLFCHRRWTNYVTDPDGRMIAIPTPDPRTPVETKLNINLGQYYDLVEGICMEHKPGLDRDLALDDVSRCYDWSERPFVPNPHHVPFKLQQWREDFGRGTALYQPSVYGHKSKYNR